MTDSPPTDSAAPPPLVWPDHEPAFHLAEPAAQSMPFVFASPHSGRLYPQSFLAASRLDPVSLRRSEDAFVDELFSGAPRVGAPLLAASFPRAYVDANREPWELDPAMFAERLPSWVNTRSLRVASGLGTVARVVAEGAEIYRGPLTFAQVQARVQQLYEPYHAALADLLSRTHDQFGCAVLIDCHSMPSAGGAFGREGAAPRADIVLGDRYGTACAVGLSHGVAEILRSLGLTVVRNLPYAGGYCTEHYGAPAFGRHALQIEINRALYMDEERILRLPALAELSAKLTEMMRQLAHYPLAPLQPSSAAAD